MSLLYPDDMISIPFFLPNEGFAYVSVLFAVNQL
jgi:hypothetical protein